jgi:BirA family transcriptional regulator, biotin operon repressor / biotin---[acetyl-CoA-carboxylase] ligase
MDELDERAIALPGIEVRVVQRCTSTNALLLAEAKPDVLLAAEEQTAGRGRRGRRWHASRGSAVTFSLARTMRRPPRELAGLALAAGVGAARALRSLGAARTALKWPNDLVIDSAKLGGILVETRSTGASTALAVIGIGINCRADPLVARRVRHPVAALEQYIAVDRNEIIARVATSLLEALAAFDAHGLKRLGGEWEAMHAHAGERVRVRLANGRILTGIAQGLAADGALSLHTGTGVQAVHSARVLSARRA